MSAPVETKVKAGTLAGALTGVVVWALVSYIPMFRNGVPEPVADLIPFLLAWIGHTVAAYLAPHTPRAAAAVRSPDLPPVKGGS